jgi:hypothetical protein
VENRESTNHNRRTALTLLSVFICIDAGIGFYHLTHGGGWVSGVTELLFAILAGIAGYLTVLNSIKGETKQSGRRKQAGLYMLSAITLVVLILSIYHFTHKGLPSGIIEAALTAMLIIIIVLIRKMNIKQSL